MKSIWVLLFLAAGMAAQNPFTEHINRGKEFLQKQDWENARKEFWQSRDAAASPKENAVAAWRLAQAYRGAGDIDQALDYYRLSLEYLKSEQAQTEMQELELQRLGKTVDAGEIHRALTRRSPFAEEAAAIDLEILFDFDKSTVRPDGRAQIQELAKAISSDDLKNKTFLITGYTDSVGKPAYNMVLSTERAGAVRDALAAATGLSKERLRCQGKGMRGSPGDSEETRRLNRRVRVALQD